MTVKFNIIASWSAHVGILLIGFFLMPYVLHVMGDTGYGTWLFLSSIAGYSGLLYLGFGQTISRFTAMYKAEEKWDRLNEVSSCIFSVYSMMACFAFFVGVSLALLAPVVRNWTGQNVLEIQLVLLILGSNVALGLLGSVYGGLLIGIQRFDLERGILVFTSVLRAILIYIFLSNTWSLLTLSLTFFAVTLIENSLYYYFAHKHIPTLKIGYGLVQKDTYRACFSFNGYNIVSLLAEYLMYRTDTIIIGAMMGPASVVPYSIAARLCQMIREPITQVGEVFLPKAGELLAQDRKDKIAKLLYKGMGLAFIMSCSVMIGGYWFSQLLIDTWVGEGYERSYLLVPLLMLGQIISLPVVIVRRVLLGMGLIRFPSIALLGASILNVTIAIILIPPYGLFGMVAGMVIPVWIIELCVILPMACKQIGMSARGLFYHVILLQAPALLALTAYCSYLGQWEHAANWTNVLLVTGGGAAIVGIIWLPMQFMQVIKKKLFPNSALPLPQPESSPTGKTDTSLAVCDDVNLPLPFKQRNDSILIVINMSFLSLTSVTLNKTAAGSRQKLPVELAGESVRTIEHTETFKINWFTRKHKIPCMTIWRELEQKLKHKRITSSSAWVNSWLEQYESEIDYEFAVGFCGTVPVGIALIVHSKFQKDGPVKLQSIHLGTAGEPNGESVVVEYNTLLAQPEIKQSFLYEILHTLTTKYQKDGIWIDGVHASDLNFQDDPTILNTHPQYLVTRIQRLSRLH